MASSSAITLTNTGFIYGGCEHAYDQVTSLRFYYAVTKVTVLVFHAGDKHNAELDIFAEGCPKPIKIRTGVTLNLLADSYTASEKRARSVIALHEQLAKQTFPFRLQRYLMAVDAHGYFFYDNKKVFANGLVSDGKRQINFKTDRPIYRKPFMVYYETQKTPAEQVLHFVLMQDFIISTKHDADVFFFLIDRFFGLRFD